MYNQIYEYFCQQKFFYRSQHGFRTGHSTELAALELLDKVIIQMDKNKLPINIYMDLSKAFDTLDHQILLTKLSYYGFGGRSLLLMRNYLSKRMQYVTYNDVSSDHLEIECGVPQGSILGPLLFIIDNRQ
jgi:retron-type reverse transcriptase